MNPKHPMTLIEGSIVSRRRRYSYRGHTITQTYRSHDVRNKTHNGYEWRVDGDWHDYGTRAKAKAAIDHKAEVAA